MATHPVEALRMATLLVAAPPVALLVVLTVLAAAVQAMVVVAVVTQQWRHRAPAQKRILFASIRSRW